MFKNYGLVTGMAIGILLGFLLARQLMVKTSGQVPVAPVHTITQDKPALPANDERKAAVIPQKVYDVLKYIRENNHALPGYVGGRVFSNREELLPREDNAGKPILYHEWDVNAKVAGQNRGTERIITGSDGRAWYTNDHYQTFKEIK